MLKWGVIFMTPHFFYTLIIENNDPLIFCVQTNE